MIIFIYGQDSFRSSQKLRELKEKFIREVDPKAESIKIINGEKTNADEIAQAMGASSLFAKKRMVIIENIFLNKNKDVYKSVRDFFAAKDEKNKNKVLDSEENIIIFVDGDSGDKMEKNVLWQYLLRQKFVQNFSLMSASNAVIYIKKRAELLGAALSDFQAMKISGMYGNDLWKIDSELKKVVNFKRGLKGKLPDGEPVLLDERDLANMTRGKADENIFALTDAIGNKNKKLALTLLENEIEAGVTETYLMHMVVRQFRILLQLRQGLDSGLSQRQMATILKLHPYVVQKSLKQAGTFSLEFLKNIFTKLVELDRDTKLGRADFKISIDLLIAGL